MNWRYVRFTMSNSATEAQAQACASLQQGMAYVDRTHLARGAVRRACSAVLSALLFTAGAHADARSSVKQILILESRERGDAALDEFTGDFRVRLDQRIGNPVRVTQLVVAERGPG